MLEQKGACLFIFALSKKISFNKELFLKNKMLLANFLLFIFLH
jgi:hypothetical protein